ncbi:MAG: glycosyltransferase family 39 protein [Bryobacteraceae bacterium]|nr:glycosyltransferase family 39 protein [Bryobacteraceae bacterium]
MTATSTPGARMETWVLSRLDRFAAAALILGLAMRVRLAATLYVNPDEAWVSLLANPTAFDELYRMAGRMAHPPLFVLLLHAVKAVSESDFALRLLPVSAGVVFPWFVYKWLELIRNKQTGFIALLLLVFAPFLVELTAQARGYALLLLFLAAALYLLETAIERQSLGRMAGFAAALYPAILTEYSAAFFAAAAGVYALWRFAEARPAAKVAALWTLTYIGAAAMYAWLYVTHVRGRLGHAAATGEFETWLSGFFPAAGENPAAFAFLGTFRQFAYLFGSESLGAIGLMLFLAGMALWWLHRRPVAAMLALPFALTCAAAFVRLHPYAFSRHSVFLAIFAAAGVAITLDWLASSRTAPMLAAAVIALPLWHASAVRDPGNMPVDAQRKELLFGALEYLRTSMPPDRPLLTDTETRQILGHYLAGREWLPEMKRLPSEERIGQWRVFAARWSYNSLDELREDLALYRERYRPRDSQPVWVMDAGFTASLAPALTEDARKELRVTQVRRFGERTLVFQVRSGE